MFQILLSKSRSRRRMAERGKKRVAKAGHPEDFWQNVQGWRQVEPSDDFLLGAKEYGFAGLEVLDGAALGTCSPAARKNPQRNVTRRTLRPLGRGCRRRHCAGRRCRRCPPS